MPVINKQYFLLGTTNAALTRYVDASGLIVNSTPINLTIQVDTNEVDALDEYMATIGWVPGTRGVVTAQQTAIVDPAFGNNATGTFGDLSKPFLTIQGALNAVPTPVDAATARTVWTILVSPGTYDEDLAVDLTHGKKIILASWGPWNLGQFNNPNWQPSNTRNITITTSDNVAFDFINPSFSIEPMLPVGTGDETEIAQHAVPRISGQINLTGVAAGTLSIQLLIEAQIYGVAGVAIVAGTTDVTLFVRRSRMRGTVTGSVLVLEDATESRFDQLLDIEGYGRIEECFLGNGMTVVAISPTNPNLPGIYDSQLSGVFTGPATDAFWFDLVTDYWFTTNGASFAGGASKRIVETVVRPAGDPNTQAYFGPAGTLTDDLDATMTTADWIQRTFPGGPQAVHINRAIRSVAIGDSSIAAGINSLAVGNNAQTSASGHQGLAQGTGTQVGAADAAAMGTNSVAGFPGAFAHGLAANAQAQYAEASGTNTLASGDFSHAEGQNTQATAQAAHSEGFTAHASGVNSHAEGDTTTASGAASHAEGSHSVANADHAHAEGESTNTTGPAGIASHAEGSFTRAGGARSHAEGSATTALGDDSHAEGLGSQTTALATAAHAEGNATTASDVNAHAEGVSTTASAPQAHAEGQTTTASATNAHAEGQNTQATAQNAHAEGFGCLASGGNSHAEGNNSAATNAIAHAEGDGTVSSGIASHAEGSSTHATGGAAHAEGSNTIANNLSAHAEGSTTTASGTASHAEGIGTTAFSPASHAEGNATVANGLAGHASGIQTAVFRDGQWGHSSGQGGYTAPIVGNSQTSLVTMTGQTDGTAPNQSVALVLGSVPAPLVLEDGKGYLFTVKATADAVQPGPTRVGRGFILYFKARRDGGVAVIVASGVGQDFGDASTNDWTLVATAAGGNVVLTFKTGAVNSATKITAEVSFVETAY